MKMPDVPRLIFWELTKACNLSCAHCRAEAGDVDCSGELDTGAVKRIIDDIRSNYSPILVLTGGEPLYRKDIHEISAYASSKGLRVALATNGTLIDRETARRIKESGTARVSVSIDGRDAASHDSFRGVPGAFDRAMEGLNCLREAGVEFQINTTVTKRNLSSIGGIHELALGSGAAAHHIFMLVPVGCGIEIADTDMISADEYEEALRWFYGRSRDSGIEFKATCAPHYYRIIREMAALEGRKLSFESDGMAAMTRGCLAGSGVCFISHRGEVRPCGYLPLKAGNLLESAFRDIWEKSELFQSLRDPGLLRGKCGKCAYRIVCGGCRARAYYESGDYLGEEPFCAYMPQS